MEEALVAALHQMTAGIYLAAAAVAGAGLALDHVRLTRISVWLLGVAALAHVLCFSVLHTLDPMPPLTDTPSAVSFMAWIGAVGFLSLLRRARLGGLVVLVAPMAFLGVFYASMRLSPVAAAAEVQGGSVPHAHVMLAGAGLAMLGLAGLAGALFLGEHRRLKRKRTLGGESSWPSLEALDGVNAVSLGVGFPLLTLGVITGVLWNQAVQQVLWTNSLHEILCVVAWAVYAVLLALRFAARHGARQCAVSAIAGFAFLFFAVLGAEFFAGYFA
jgi:ABC-type transport system involved in cytochrome c biogenesis permease subunit